MRNALIALALLAAVAAAGCLGGADADDRCPVCGMPNDLYDGPHGKIVLSDGEEIEFCSTVDLLRVTTEPGFEDRGVAAVRVQDAAATVWKDPEGGWIDARTAHYVAGSDRRAAMGRTLVPFGDREDAESFARRHGGTILAYGDIDRATLSRHTHY